MAEIANFILLWFSIVLICGAVVLVIALIGMTVYVAYRTTLEVAKSKMNISWIDTFVMNMSPRRPDYLRDYHEWR